MPQKSAGIDANGDDSNPQALAKLDVFNELLRKLQSMHEEVCARNAVLEGRPAHVVSHAMMDDPWLPINFWPPPDTPAPCRPPRGAHHSPKAFDVHALSGLARQQEHLCQGIDALAKQQFFLGQQITRVVTTSPGREQGNLTGKALTEGRASERWRSNTTGNTLTNQPSNGAGDLEVTTNQSLVSAFAGPQGSAKSQHSTQKNWRTSKDEGGQKNDDLGLSSQFLRETMMPWLSRIVHSNRFDFFFSGLILMNSLLMAFELQYHGMNYGSTTFGMKESMKVNWAEDFLEISDWFFGVLFTAELIANLLVHRIAFFVQPAVLDDEAEAVHSRAPRNLSENATRGCKMVCSRLYDSCSRIDLWGVLDFCVVLLWLMYKIFAAGLPFDPMVFRLARLAKLLRMLRLVKVISSFDSLYLLTTTIQGSISALVWSVALLFVVQALLSFIMCQQLATYWENKSGEDYDDRKQIWLYFGTYTRSLFTMFELTLGNWVPVGRALMDKVNTWFFILSLMHKFLIGFAVVNVMNGVFMQTTFKIAATDDQIMIRQRERQSRIHRAKMTKLFRRGDKDYTGFLTREAFENLVADPAFRKWMASMELSIFKEEDVDAVFFLLAGPDNQISLDELVRETSRLKGPARTIDIELRFQEIRDIIASLERSIGTSNKSDSQKG